MELFDLHVHTRDFSDGELSVEDVVEVSKFNRVRVGIADHVSASRSHAIATPIRLHEYLTTLMAYPVYRAVEVDLGEQPPFIPSHQLLDYIIGGVHWIQWHGKRLQFFCGDVEVVEVNDFMEALLDQIEEALESTTIHVLAHPTALPSPLWRRSRELWTRARTRRLAHIASRRGVALEVNNLFRVPDGAAIAELVSCGAMLSVGSDGHRPQDVANLDYVRQIVQTLDIDEGRFFRPVRGLSTR